MVYLLQTFKNNMANMKPWYLLRFKPVVIRIISIVTILCFVISNSAFAFQNTSSQLRKGQIEKTIEQFAAGFTQDVEKLTPPEVKPEEKPRSKKPSFFRNATFLLSFLVLGSNVFGPAVSYATAELSTQNTSNNPWFENYEFDKEGNQQVTPYSEAQTAFEIAKARYASGDKEGAVVYYALAIVLDKKYAENIPNLLMFDVLIHLSKQYDYEAGWLASQALVENLKNRILNSSEEDAAYLMRLLDNGLVATKINSSPFLNDICTIIGEIARQKPNLIQATTVSGVENVLKMDGFGIEFAYLSAADALTIIQEKRPELITPSSVFYVMSSLPREILGHGLVAYKVYINSDFKELTQNMSAGNKHSIALSTYRLLVQHNKAVDDENISKTVKFIIGKRSDIWSNILFGPGITVVNIRGQERPHDDYYEEQYSKIRDVQIRAGVSADAIFRFEGKNNKVNILKYVGESKGPVTITFDGHGQKEYYLFDFLDDISSRMTYQELGNSLITRFKKGENLENVTVVTCACYGYNFNTNLLSYLYENGITIFPTLISVTNFNRRSSIDPNDLFYRIEEIHQPRTPITIGNMFETEQAIIKISDNDLTIFISVDDEEIKKIGLKDEDSSQKSENYPAVPPNAIEIGQLPKIFHQPHVGDSYNVGRYEEFALDNEAMLDISPASIGKKAKFEEKVSNTARLQDSKGNSHSIKLVKWPLNIEGLKLLIQQSFYLDQTQKKAILSKLALLEKSPPEIYTYSKLVEDLFAFASPENNLIAFHESLKGNPIAIFHEVREYLTREKIINLKLENNVIIVTDTDGNEIERIKLTREDAKAIAQKGTNSPHYLLRAWQREVFGELDEDLTKTIKEEQVKAAPTQPEERQNKQVPQKTPSTFLSTLSTWQSTDKTWNTVTTPADKEKEGLTYVVNLPGDYPEIELLLSSLRMKLGNKATIKVVIRGINEEGLFYYQRLNQTLGLNLSLEIAPAIANTEELTTTLETLKVPSNQRYLFVTQPNNPEEYQTNTLDSLSLNPNLTVALVKEIDPAQPTNTTPQVLKSFFSQEKIVVITPQPITNETLRDELKSALEALRRA